MTCEGSYQASMEPAISPASTSGTSRNSVMRSPSRPCRRWPNREWSAIRLSLCLTAGHSKTRNDVIAATGGLLPDDQRTSQVGVDTAAAPMQKFRVRSALKAKVARARIALANRGRALAMRGRIAGTVVHSLWRVPPRGAASTFAPRTALRPSLCRVLVSQGARPQQELICGVSDGFGMEQAGLYNLQRVVAAGRRLACLLGRVELRPDQGGRRKHPRPAPIRDTAMIDTEQFIIFEVEWNYVTHKDNRGSIDHNERPIPTTVRRIFARCRGCSSDFVAMSGSASLYNAVGSVTLRHVCAPRNWTVESIPLANLLPFATT